MGDDNQPLRLGTYLQEDAPLFGIDGLQGLRLPPIPDQGVSLQVSTTPSGHPQVAATQVESDLAKRSQEAPDASGRRSSRTSEVVYNTCRTTSTKLS